ncbi:progestin and adipoQ receptor family member 3 isoform X1 [Athene cunicularia]|uniref:progestin and adipoQ receptor family member 3 isoform X1 n=1 Tax=Athene cunicularia TaxID=194338 RepID=UPI000EF72A70|nr:progestin and adipoQ receptor family member 3 isoform X1 [Athene cunicularia]
MLCSVGYHLFCCHRSEKTSRRWMALDYAGISIGILGCYVSGVFYAFYCNNYWRQVYLITVLAMILAVFFAQIHPSYLTQQWHRLRSIIFCSVSGYGIIPTIHWVWLNGGIGASIVQEFAPRVVVMYFIAAVAFLFYISKVPERYFPGQLNYLGSSHQVWHILAVVMLYWWHQSTVYIMQYRHSKPCPEYSPDLTTSMKFLTLRLWTLPNELRAMKLHTEAVLFLTSGLSPAGWASILLGVLKNQQHCLESDINFLFCNQVQNRSSCSGTMERWAVRLSSQITAVFFSLGKHEQQK